MVIPHSACRNGDPAASQRVVTGDPGKRGYPGYPVGDHPAELSEDVGLVEFLVGHRALLRRIVFRDDRAELVPRNVALDLVTIWYQENFPYRDPI